MFVEPRIHIEGHDLNEGQAMTLRVALETFAIQLGEPKFANQLGETLAQGYLARIAEIRFYMGYGPTPDSYPGQSYWRENNPNIKRAEENAERLGTCAYGSHPTSAMPPLYVHHKTEFCVDWKPVAQEPQLCYTIEQLTMMLDAVRVQGVRAAMPEAEYHRGGKEAFQRVIDRFPEVREKVEPWLSYCAHSEQAWREMANPEIAANALLDTIEKDFCRCGAERLHRDRPNWEYCGIHERVDALRAESRFVTFAKMTPEGLEFLRKKVQP